MPMFRFTKIDSVPVDIDKQKICEISEKSCTSNEI